MRNIVEQNAAAFSKVAAEYTEDYLEGAEKYLIEHFFKGKKVLVLGCGGGRLLPPLVERGFEVTGIDIVPEMVALAQEKMRTRNLPATIIHMDAAHLTFSDNSFDVVFFPFNGIGYVHPDIYAAVREARRVMKPDGVFVFSAHNRLSLQNLHRFF